MSQPATTTSLASSAAHPAPRHVAFIMDGNGRWATRRGLARLRGHAAGIETVKQVVESLAEAGVAHTTFYAFSTENWQRPLEEVRGIFDLMRVWFRREMNDLMKKGVRVRFIGNRTDGRLAADILDLMAEVEAQTAANTRITATFALNYSGRDELLRAVNTLVAAGTPATAETLAAHLDTHGIPDPDLIIRTSGEQRISNFLLWQLAYAELYFTSTPWPDFSATHLAEALEAYATRQRRFGATPAQAALAPAA